MVASRLEISVDELVFELPGRGEELRIRRRLGRVQV
jgi:hypothetical protein